MYNYIGQILHHTSKKMQHYLEAPHKSFFLLFLQSATIYHHLLPEAFTSKVNWVINNQFR